MAPSTLSAHAQPSQIPKRSKRLASKIPRLTQIKCSQGSSLPPTPPPLNPRRPLPSQFSDDLFDETYESSIRDGQSLLSSKRFRVNGPSLPLRTSSRLSNIDSSMATAYDSVASESTVTQPTPYDTVATIVVSEGTPYSTVASLSSTNAHLETFVVQTTTETQGPLPPTVAYLSPLATESQPPAAPPADYSQRKETDEEKEKEGEAPVPFTVDYLSQQQDSQPPVPFTVDYLSQQQDSQPPSPLTIDYLSQSSQDSQPPAVPPVDYSQRLGTSQMSSLGVLDRPISLQSVSDIGSQPPAAPSKDYSQFNRGRPLPDTPTETIIEVITLEDDDNENKDERQDGGFNIEDLRSIRRIAHNRAGRDGPPLDIRTRSPDSAPFSFEQRVLLLSSLQAVLYARADAHFEEQF